MNFKEARFNMVEQQIRPWDVLDFLLLDILNDIPREHFIDNEKYKNLAYADIEIPLDNGFCMIEPKIVARLIQALNLNKDKVVLEIATGSGYSTAILASLAKSVDTVDIDNEQLNKAKQKLDELNFNNINYINEDGLGLDSNNPIITKKYDAIYIGGALHFLPENLLSLLNDNGYIVAIVGLAPVMQAKLFIKNNQETIEKSIFETNIPYLNEKNYNKSNEFIF